MVLKPAEVRITPACFPGVLTSIFTLTYRKQVGSMSVGARGHHAFAEVGESLPRHQPNKPRVAPRLDAAVESLREHPELIFRASKPKLWT